MLTKWCLVLFVIAFLLIHALDALAAPPRKKPSVKPSSEFVSADIPFNTSLDCLPPRYAGVSAKSLYKKLEPRRQQLLRDEFETWEAYQGRLAVLNKSIGFYAISREPMKAKPDMPGFMTELSYDPDRGCYEVTLRKSHYDSWSNVSGERSRRTVGSYPAQTIGGARVTVRVEEVQSWDFKLSQTLGERWARGDVTHEIKMTPEEARKAKDEIRILDVFQPSELVSEQSGWTPSWPNMTTGKILDYVVKGHVKEVWIYNFTTGQVYVKHQFEGRDSDGH